MSKSDMLLIGMAVGIALMTVFGIILDVTILDVTTLNVQIKCYEKYCYNDSIKIMIITTDTSISVQHRQPTWEDYKKWIVEN